MSQPEYQLSLERAAMKNRFSFSKSSRRDLLRAGMYGVCVTAGASIPVPVFGQAAAQLAAQGRRGREDTGRAGALRRQRRPQHAGALRRRCLLQAPAECWAFPRRKSAGIDDHFGFSGGMAGFRALVQRRQARHRARLRLRQSFVLAFHVDGLLAHRGAEQRRRIRLGRAVWRMRWRRPRRRISS